MANEAVEEQTPAPPQPSFRGRLQMQDFMFKPAGAAAELPTALRRSPRLAAPPSATPSPSPSPAPVAVSRKRKRTTTVATTLEATITKADTTATTTSPSKPGKNKAKRPKAGYAPPSTYAHLPHLPDALGPNLLVLFVGLNPGIQTARTGHAYAHPSNLFWKLLASSGVTPVPCRADEDRGMPARFSLGLTNIVSRPSRNGAELLPSELDAGVAVLEAKARRWRPEAVCVVGKSIWESLWRVRHGRAIRKDEFRYGWQDEGENMGVIKVKKEKKQEIKKEEDDEGDKEEGVAEGVRDDPDWKGARLFVASSTSGLAATLSPAEKEVIWRQLGVWVEKRRKEREEEKVKEKEAGSI